MSVKIEKGEKLCFYQNRMRNVKSLQSFNISRHDHHSVEVKSTLAGDRERYFSQLDLHLFMPNTMRMSTYPKASLLHDFSSRIRISRFEEIYSNDRERLESETAELLELLNQYFAGERTDALKQAVFDGVRHLGAVFNEKIKSAAGAHANEIFFAHSLLSKNSPRAAFERLAEEIGALARSIERVRELVDADVAGEFEILSLLDEFVHQLTLDYLGNLNDRLKESSATPAPYHDANHAEGREAISRALGAILAGEAKRRATTLAHASSDEERLFRMGQLKKFFQSEMFFELVKRDSRRRFTEPAAILGATLSALLALGLEHASKSGWLSISFGSASVVCAGIFLYVFKDRMKDRGKNYFFQKIGGILPDFEQDLILNKKKVGEVRETFNVRSKAKISPEIRKIRDQHSLSLAERHLEEEVFCYSRLIDFQCHGLAAAAPSSALREVMRINLERYLKYMDDAYKEVTVLTETGQLSVARFHRIYCFYLVLSHAVVSPKRRGMAMKTLGKKAVRESSVYRIVLDKKGIQKIEEVSPSAMTAAGAGMGNLDIASDPVLEQRHLGPDASFREDRAVLAPQFHAKPRTTHDSAQAATIN